MRKHIMITLAIILAGLVSASIPKLGENTGSIPKIETDELGQCIDIYNNMTNYSYYASELITDIYLRNDGDTATGDYVMVGKIGVNTTPVTGITIKDTDNPTYGTLMMSGTTYSNDYVGLKVVTNADNDIDLQFVRKFSVDGTAVPALTFGGKTGNIGMGLVAPSDRLTVSGNVNISGCYELANGTIIGGACISDERLKTNITDSVSNISKSSQLKVKNFFWENDTIFMYDNMVELPKTQQRGFIAQEVEEVYPERVIEEEGIKKVVYGWDWFFDIWGYVQNHEQRIEQLESENQLIKQELCMFNPASELCK